MSFDIPQLHIADNSPEARVIAAIIERDHVSAEEAVLRALREMSITQISANSSAHTEGKKPGELLFGLFADDPELMRRIARTARRARNREIVKDLSA